MALSVALAMNWSPLRVSIPVVVAAAFLLLRLSENQRVKGDSAIALILHHRHGPGGNRHQLDHGMNVDVYSYMFGSILAMSWEDVYLSVGLCACVLALFVIFYNKIFAVTFDESFAGPRAPIQAGTTCSSPCLPPSPWCWGCA